MFNHMSTALILEIKNENIEEVIYFEWTEWIIMNTLRIMTAESR